jgi:hypothetical protein
VSGNAAARPDVSHGGPDINRGGGDVTRGGPDDRGTPTASDRGVGPSAGPQGDPSGENRHPAIAFLRANPQVCVLLVICLMLGIGTFLVVLFGLATAGSDQTTGEPSGVILGAHTLTGLTRSLLL